jgi:hypothetical protein
MIAINTYFFLALLFMGIFGPIVSFVVGASFGRSDDSE